MTRGTTWSNPDGLIVGFGPNIPERNAGAVMTQKGTDTKVAKLHFTYLSTFGSSGANITVPAGSVIKNVYLKINTNFAGGTSLAVGDTNASGGWITSTQGAVANLVTTNSPIQAGGSYAIATGSSAAAPKPYPTSLAIFLTAVGTFTAGDADLYVEYA